VEEGVKLTKVNWGGNRKKGEWNPKRNCRRDGRRVIKNTELITVEREEKEKHRQRKEKSTTLLQ